MIKKLFVLLIRVYQIAISPFFPQSCKFYPSCSSYGVDAIGKYGVIKGNWMLFKRILRCNPYSHGGYDPVK